VGGVDEGNGGGGAGRLGVIGVLPLVVEVAEVELDDAGGTQKSGGPSGPSRLAAAGGGEGTGGASGPVPSVPPLGVLTVGSTSPPFGSDVADTESTCCEPADGALVSLLQPLTITMTHNTPPAAMAVAADTDRILTAPEPTHEHHQDYDSGPRRHHTNTARAGHPTAPAHPQGEPAARSSVGSGRGGEQSSLRSHPCLRRVLIWMQGEGGRYMSDSIDPPLAQSTGATGVSEPVDHSGGLVERVDAVEAFIEVAGRLVAVGDLKWVDVEADYRLLAINVALRRQLESIRAAVLLARQDLGHLAVAFAVDDWNRRTPIALTGDQPVAQAELCPWCAAQILSCPINHFFLCFVI